jgi:hypothetical protein
VGKVNWGRVILGGLLAGLVVNLFEWAVGMVLQEEYKAALAALGKTMDESAMVFYLVYGFVYGIFAIWLYAAIRPRFGPGPKTAVCAGFAVWFVGYLLPLLGYGAQGLYPTRLVAIGCVVGLVETVLGTVSGAWLYKEA